MKQTVTTCDFCGRDTTSKSITAFEEDEGLALRHFDICPECWAKGFAAMRSFQAVKLMDSEGIAK